MEDRSKKISLKLRCQTELQIQRYYEIFTILNNLLINSADACKEEGTITLLAEVKDRELCLEVRDDGAGMDADTQKYIWGAGFSTKYDRETGQMSTGIGLCHVLNIVTDMRGRVEMESELTKGTIFTIRLPIEQLGRMSTELEEGGTL